MQLLHTKSKENKDRTGTENTTTTDTLQLIDSCVFPSIQTKQISHLSLLKQS